MHGDNVRIIPSSLVYQKGDISEVLADASVVTTGLRAVQIITQVPVTVVIVMTICAPKHVVPQKD